MPIFVIVRAQGATPNLRVCSCLWCVRVSRQTVLPGLVIYHQFRDFERSAGDKFFVQITSDFSVISVISQKLRNFCDFQAIFGQIW